MGQRERGWSGSPEGVLEGPDRLDGLLAPAYVCLAVLIREGLGTLPAAELDERALEIKLLLDHREDLVRERTAIQGRLRWHLHDLWGEDGVPVGGLDRAKWLDRLARRLARCEQ
ncbi:MAG: IS110 family transposase, partial [Actinomycetota bacterium]|nr:IS110 family transposase [Actinomycetota bacterium]